MNKRSPITPTAITVRWCQRFTEPAVAFEAATAPFCPAGCYAAWAASPFIHTPTCWTRSRYRTGPFPPTRMPTNILNSWATGRYVMNEGAADINYLRWVDLTPWAKPTFRTVVQWRAEPTRYPHLPPAHAPTIRTWWVGRRGARTTTYARRPWIHARHLPHGLHDYGGCQARNPTPGAPHRVDDER